MAAGVAIAAALALFQSPTPAAPPSGAAEAQAWSTVVDRLRASAPLAFAQVRTRCLPSDIAARPITGEVAFQSGSDGEHGFNAGVQDIAASPSGAVAVASLERKAVLVFPAGFGSRPVTAPLEGAYSGDSLTLSSDRRRVAWIGGGASKTYVLDMPTGGVATLPITGRSCEAQWFGRDLLVRVCPGRTLVFRGGPGALARALVSDDPPFSLHSDFLARRAIADRAGSSLLRDGQGRVYATPDEALADGALIAPSGALTPGPLRVGDRLVSYPMSGADGLLRSLDGRTGAVMATRDLPADCTPVSVAAALDGRRFALLQRGGLVQVVVAADLKTSAAFQLPHAGLHGLPTKIVFLADGRLAAASADRVTLYRLEP